MDAEQYDSLKHYMIMINTGSHILKNIINDFVDYSDMMDESADLKMSWKNINLNDFLDSIHNSIGRSFEVNSKLDFELDI